jgi:hypothetical protein
MKKTFNYLAAGLLLFLITNAVKAQNYTFDDFVGTWNGTIFSPSTNGATVPMTMIIEADGFYTETSGHLMPTLYPNTQQVEYLPESNRLHWWYLGTAWGGQNFYTHFFYNVVYFENGVLELHYNFWNDPEPQPQTGIIYLIKEGAAVMPPPDMLSYQWMDESISLAWNEPDPGTGQLADLTGYNIYHQQPDTDPVLLAFTEELSFIHEDSFAVGIHNYYVTAVYDGDESLSSNIISVNFLSPAPADFEGRLVTDMIELSWTRPDAGNEPLANLEGYTVYHKPENGTFEMLAFVEETFFVHESLQTTGMHTYYVTAAYTGGVSDPTNEIEFLYSITSLADDLKTKTSIYPNPATDFVNLTSEQQIQQVNILNQTGQLISTERVNAKSYSLDVRALQSGVYILTIENANGFASEMIVVK